MIVAGVDPSTRSTGVAVLDHGRPVMVGHHGHRGTQGDGYLIRNRRVRAEIAYVNRTLAPYPIDYAVVEILPPGNRGGFVGRDDRVAILNGIIGALDYRGIPIAFVLPSSAKLWATGSGRADKEDVIAAVNTWWPPGPDRVPIENDDEADALVMALLAAYKVGDPLPFPIERRHPHIFDVGDWSAIA